MKHFENIQATDENDPEDGQKCKIHTRLGIPIFHRSECTSETGLFLPLQGKRGGIQLENGCECNGVSFPRVESGQSRKAEVVTIKTIIPLSGVSQQNISSLEWYRSY